MCYVHIITDICASEEACLKINAFNSESPVYEIYFPYVKKNKLSSTQLLYVFSFIF